MKVSELEGARLAFWTGTAVGEKVQLTESGEFCEYWKQHENGEDLQDYLPHLLWEQCGPLIEQLEIEIGPMMDGRWTAARWDTDSLFGPTPLIAACRAIVTSMYGEEVPDEAS